MTRRSEALRLNKAKLTTERMLNLSAIRLGSLSSKVKGSIPGPYTISWRTVSSQSEPYDVDVPHQLPFHFWKEEYSLTDGDRWILSDPEKCLNDKQVDAGQKMCIKQHRDSVIGLARYHQVTYPLSGH